MTDKQNRYITISQIIPIILFFPFCEALANFTGHSIFFNNVINDSRILFVINAIFGSLYILAYLNGLTAIIIDLFKKEKQQQIILTGLFVIEIIIVLIKFINLAITPVFFILHLITRNWFAKKDKVEKNKLVAYLTETAKLTPKKLLVVVLGALVIVVFIFVIAIFIMFF